MGLGEDVARPLPDGPLLLALPVAAAAGLVSFLSPCCLPLMPGYLSYVTGLAGTYLAAPPPAGGLLVEAPPRQAHRARIAVGSMLFVVGFSVVFISEGL